MADYTGNPIVPPSKHSDWYARASRALADAGYRRGGARLALLGLLDAQPCALSAVEIEEALRHRSPAPRTASRASIYRILDELEALDLVARLEVGQGIVRFEAAREGSGHHHHLICDHCGTLTPFTDAELERTISAVSERVALDVSEHEVVLHGACSSCAP
jgi:Fur family ferric uptake transcriptional regulator